MSEAEKAEEFEAQETEETSEEKPKSEFSFEDWQKSQEEKARAAGWKPLDEYVAEGGDPDKWRDANGFNTYGEVIGIVKKTKQEADSRIEGIVKLTEAQLKAQREELTQKRDALIDEGGRTSEVKAIDKQLETLQIPQSQPQIHPALQEWNEKNPWIDEDSPKSAYARAQFQQAVSQGKSVEGAVQHVNAALAKAYPPEKKAPQVPESEAGKGSRGYSQKKGKLTMSDLTQEEHKWLNALPGAWKDDKEKLQAVADARAAQGVK